MNRASAFFPSLRKRNLVLVQRDQSVPNNHHDTCKITVPASISSKVPGGTAAEETRGMRMIGGCCSSTHPQDLAT